MRETKLTAPTLSREEILNKARRILDAQPESLTAAPKLLRDVEAFFRRFVVLPEASYLPLATWSLATHIFEMFHAYGYVAMQSPVRGCGKTRVLEVLECVCVRPWRVNSVTPAVIFRKIGGSKPTLLLAAISHTGRLCGDRWVVSGVASHLTAGNRLRDEFGGGAEGPIADRSRICRIAPPRLLRGGCGNNC